MIKWSLLIHDLAFPLLYIKFDLSIKAKRADLANFNWAGPIIDGKVDH